MKNLDRGWTGKKEGHRRYFTPFSEANTRKDQLSRGWTAPQYLRLTGIPHPAGLLVHRKPSGKRPSLKAGRRQEGDESLWYVSEKAANKPRAVITINPAGSSDSST